MTSTRVPYGLGNEVDQAERFGSRGLAVELPLRITPERARLSEALLVGEAVEKGRDRIDVRGVVQGELAQAEGAVHDRGREHSSKPVPRGTADAIGEE